MKGGLLRRPAVRLAIRHKRALRIGDASVRSSLVALTEGREAANTKAVTTASTPPLLLQASSGSARRAPCRPLGSRQAVAAAARRYLCKSAIVLAGAPAALSARSASTGRRGTTAFTIAPPDFRALPSRRRADDGRPARRLCNRPTPGALTWGLQVAVAALALPDSPSYSRSVLAGTVDTRHIDELLDDAQLTTIVHLAREAARPMGKGPKRPQRQFCAERRQRVRVRNRSISSRFISGRYWARTSDLLLVRQALYQLS
jgi:hypothetical protein